MILIDGMPAFAQIEVWDFETKPVWFSEKFYGIKGCPEGVLLSGDEQKIVRAFFDFLESVDFPQRLHTLKISGGSKKAERVECPVGASNDFEVFYAPRGSGLQAIVDEL